MNDKNHAAGTGDVIFLGQRAARPGTLSFHAYIIPSPNKKRERQSGQRNQSNTGGRKQGEQTENGYKQKTRFLKETGTTYALGIAMVTM